MMAERASINRANESPEKGNERKETYAKRMKVNRFNNRVNQSPEKAKELKEKSAERARKYRLNKKVFQEARKERMRKQVMRSVNQAPPPDQGINPEDVPNISQYVETRESIISAYEHLMKTELKANENFLKLQDELASTENQILTARTRFNESVQDYNGYILAMPQSWFLGNYKEKAYFQAVAGADKPVEVKF
jgi:hypothetical protein